MGARRYLSAPRVLGVLTAAAVSPIAAQSTTSATWAGWAQCVATTQGQGYANQQTHTWTTSGGAPTAQGAMQLHPATWSAAGSGSLQRSQGSQTLEAQWTTSVAGVSGPISVLVRASDGRRLIRAGHAQLRQRGGVAGTQTQTVSGRAPSVTELSLEAFEWAFPAIEDVATATRIQGSSSGDVAGSFGPMQPGGARTTATCRWDFSQGAAPSPVPPVSTASEGPASPTGAGAPPTSASSPLTPPPQPP